MKNKLKKLREEIGLSQSDIANRLNITRQAYNNYETGKREPDFETIVKIADILGTTTDYLLGRNVHKPQHINDDEALEYLDELHKRPEMKTLFQVTRRASKEDIQTAITIIEALKKKEQPED